MRKALVALVVWLCLTAGLEASKPTTENGQWFKLKTGQSLSHVLQKARVSQVWLSRVMADNHILPQDIQHPPVGRRVLVKAEYQNAIPPPDVASLSQVILAYDQGDKVRKEQVATLRTDLNEARTQFTEARKEASIQREHVNQLVAQAADWEKKAKKSAAEAESMIPGRALLVWVVTAAILGLLLGGAGSWYWQERRIVQMQGELTGCITIPNGLGARYFEQEVVFPLDSYQRDPALTGTLSRAAPLVALYKCPLCPENRIKSENVVQHIRGHEARQAAEARQEV